MNKEENFTFQDFFKAIKRFKLSIFFFTILGFIVAFLYQYYQQNIYRAQAIVEISAPLRSNNKDILSDAFSTPINIKTEMEVLQSRAVNSLALQKVDFAHQYYAYLEKRNSDTNNIIDLINNTFGKYKKVDIYDKTPFKIELKKGYGIPFIVQPIDQKRFELTVQYKDNNKTINYHNIHQYNQEVNTSYFTFTLKKLKEPKYKKYLILVENPQKLIDIIRNKLIIRRTDLTSNSIKIIFEDTIAKRAQKYVNAIADAYIKQNIDYKVQEANKKLQFIHKQLAQIIQKLKTSSQKLTQFESSQNIINLDEKSSFLVRKSSDIKSQLEKLLLQKDILNRLYTQLKRGNTTSTIAVAGIEANNAVLSSLVAKLQEALIEQKTLLARYTRYHPEVVKQSRIIYQLKQAIFKTIKTSLAVTNKKIERLKALLKQYDEKISHLPKQAQTLSNLKRNYLVSQKLYNYLLEKEAEISLIKESTLNNTRIIDYASTDLKPVKPKRKLILILGLILGFILGILQAFIRKELGSNTIQEDADEIEKKIQIPVIATIPHFSNLKKYTIGIYKDLNSKFAESFRILRTELKFLLNNEKGKVITVSSYKKGEGKTTIAVNLAFILGLANKKTIIIDADLRNGDVAKYMQADESIGLTNYLLKELDIVHTIQLNLNKGVDVITTGPKNEIPSELLESKDFEKLINRLKQFYDYIIIDTPSYKDYADAKLLLLYSDINLFVVRSGYSENNILKKLKSIKYSKRNYIVLNDIR